MRYVGSSASGSSWEDLIEIYSQRPLTYDTDRSSALAGLAASFARSHSKRQCADFGELGRHIACYSKKEAQ